MNTQWQKITEILRNSLDSGIFRIWITPLDAEISGSTIKIKAPSGFVASWVRKHLLKNITDAAARALNIAIEQIRIDIYADKAQNADAASTLLASAFPTATQRTLPLAAPAPKPSTQVWRYRFEDFVTGSSNRLAAAAARDMCEHGQVRTLFVTSAPGLGKTHLTHAAGQLFSQGSGPLNIIYLTCEQFASRFVAAMRTKDLESFKQTLCKADVLLLEDVHFLQRKKAMQEFMLAVIKNLQSRGSRVIFTSSFTPRQLQDLDSELASQFCSGILASMDKPDLQMRREILQRKARLFQVHLPDEVCNLVSERISSDVRQLESCLQSMIFKARILNSGLTVDMALETMGQYASAEQVLDIKAIVRLVCESFGLTETQLRSKSRKHEYVQGRNTVFYLARKHTEMSLEGIGGVLNRKHSTVMRSITQVEQELAKESSEGRQIARAVALIEKKCGLSD